CTNYCLATNKFVSGQYDTVKKSCTCVAAEGSAVACDDSRANSERPDSVGCFEQVGVSGVSCPPTEAPTTSGGGSFSALSSTTLMAASLLSVAVLMA
ncbi:MAG: hypothetical protein SGARI_007642, partial [Bacillariaceae sp.]